MSDLGTVQVSIPPDVTRPDWALCIGGAATVWDDVVRFERECLNGTPWPGWVIAANDIGCHWPRVLHHWVTLHPAKLAGWKAARVAAGLPGPGVSESVVTWAKRYTAQKQLSDHHVEIWGGGSSGMLAAQLGGMLGCTKVILCGIPMTPTAHFAETKERFADKWHSAAGHWRAWVRHQSKFKGWCTSMSGRTAELLGTPSAGWLGESPQKT